jgi:Acetyltransferase (GNAT) family
VCPRFRKKKVGRALVSRVAAIAEEESCFAIIFHVLDWNETAIEFYKRMNAMFLDDWKTVCLKDNALRLVAHCAVDPSWVFSGRGPFGSLCPYSVGIRSHPAKQEASTSGCWTGPLHPPLATLFGFSPLVAFTTEGLLAS